VLTHGPPVLIAAGAPMTAIPMLPVYFALRRRFISGLTLELTL
jgi:ABC-type glycerol-3-phosphate transport system permease component